MRRPQLKFSPYLVPSLFSIVWLPWYQLQWRTQVCQNQQPGITQPLQKPEAIEVLFIIEFYLALTRKYFLLGKDKLYACIIFTDPPALRGLTLTCSTMLSSWTVPTTGILSRTNWTLLKEKRTSPGTQTTSSCSSTELSPPPPILVSPCVCSAYTVHRQDCTSTTPLIGVALCVLSIDSSCTSIPPPSILFKRKKKNNLINSPFMMRVVNNKQ